MKTVKKFKTINQVSKYFNIPQHVLRFWENKFIQLTPLKLSGNRRYYRDIDIKLIGYIKNLLYQDHISIKGVQKIFGNKKVNQILRTSNPILKKKNVLDNKTENNKVFANENKIKNMIKEILIELKKIKNSL
tara:strand:- start:12324 stop:12719 length:396 start_codon:yes stop_codon:yes gene_type:complete